MIEPDSINPREVLLHLNSLGFCNITPHQLKEFLHDLKKLIKYEQRQNSMKFDPHNSRCCDCECSCAGSDNYSFKKLEINEPFESSSNSECSSSCSCQKDRDLKFDESTKISPRSDVYGDKIQTSCGYLIFIRPWNLPVYNNLSGRSKSNLDPVKLYHQYKECWNRLGIPGESKHSQLRWLVRNKMLGQEPHPRVNR